MSEQKPLVFTMTVTEKELLDPRYSDIMRNKKYVFALMVEEEALKERNRLIQLRKPREKEA